MAQAPAVVGSFDPAWLDAFVSAINAKITAREASLDSDSRSIAAALRDLRDVFIDPAITIPAVVRPAGGGES